MRVTRVMVLNPEILPRLHHIPLDELVNVFGLHLFHCHPSPPVAQPFLPAFSPLLTQPPSSSRPQSHTPLRPISPGSTQIPPAKPQSESHPSPAPATISSVTLRLALPTHPPPRPSATATQDTPRQILLQSKLLAPPLPPTNTTAIHA